MYVRGKRLQKGTTHSRSALQQRRTDGRRHTRETTETGACDYSGRRWKGRRNEKGGKIVAYLYLTSYSLLQARFSADTNNTAVTAIDKKTTMFWVV